MNISALDDSGNAVDWWFAYKVPKLISPKSGATPASATGYEYVYFDPNMTAVKRSPHILGDGKGALDLTLKAVFDHAEPTTGWILYNDEMPASANRKDDGNLGHTKGVIAFDTESHTAFWLLHSWPKYYDPGATAMPTPMFGQTFLCISLDLGTASRIAAQMANNQEPQVYLPRIPLTLPKNDPLYRLTLPLNPNAPSDSESIDYESRGGLAFKVIAKNRKWGRDFWNDLVGPTLREDMDDETWIRGPIAPTLDSDGIHKTFDIKFIDLRPLGAPWVWPETKDHAKWGITLASNWVCVGDMNRMISQEKRGGGTIAFQNETLWEALKKTDCMVTPPGMTAAEALDAVQATHGASKHHAQAITALRAKSKTKSAAARKTTGSTVKAPKKGVKKKKHA